METEKLDLGIGVTLFFSDDSFLVMGNGLTITIPHNECTLFSNSIHTLTISLRITHTEAAVISRISGKEIRRLLFEA